MWRYRELKSRKMSANMQELRYDAQFWPLEIYLVNQEIEKPKWPRLSCMFGNITRSFGDVRITSEKVDL